MTPDPHRGQPGIRNPIRVPLSWPPRWRLPMLARWVRVKVGFPEAHRNHTLCRVNGGPTGGGDMASARQGDRVRDLRCLIGTSVRRAEELLILYDDHPGPVLEEGPEGWCGPG